MKRKLSVLWLVILLPVLAWGQRIAQDTCTIGSTGGTCVFNNTQGAVTSSFEEKISGAPATVSITIQGCMRGGTCDTAADTYAVVADSIRNPQFSTVYDYFKVTASWTGGASPSVKINMSTTISKTGGGGFTPYGLLGTCLVSNGPGTPPTWQSCTGTASSNFASLVANAANTSGGTFTYGTGTGASYSDTGFINANRFAGVTSVDATEFGYLDGITSAIQTQLNTRVITTRNVLAGTGLSGGGDLSADRTLAVSYGTTAGTAAQGNDARIVGAVQVGASNVYTTGTQDFTNATLLKLRVAAGLSTASNGEFGFNSTDNNWQAWDGATNQVVALLSGAFTDTHCLKITKVGNKLTITDAGASCGTGGGGGYPSITENTSDVTSTKKFIAPSYESSSTGAAYLEGPNNQTCPVPGTGKLRMCLDQADGVVLGNSGGVNVKLIKATDTIPESAISLNDNTTGNASASKHGFLAKTVGSAGYYLNGLNSFAAFPPCATDGTQAMVLSGSSLICVDVAASALKVATPTHTPDTSDRNDTTAVTVATTTGGATCKYCADNAGSCDPFAGTTYTTPVSVSPSGAVARHLRSGCSAAGLTDSNVKDSTYTFVAATPTDSPGQGSYAGSQSVTLASTTPSAYICYTVDGSTPAGDGSICSTGTHYTGAFNVASTTTVKAIATKTDYNASSVLSSVYTITGGPVPTFVSGCGWVNQAASPTTCTITGYTAGNKVYAWVGTQTGNSNVPTFGGENMTQEQTASSGSGTKMTLYSHSLASSGNKVFSFADGANYSTGAIGEFSNATGIDGWKLKWDQFGSSSHDALSGLTGASDSVMAMTVSNPGSTGWDFTGVTWSNMTQVAAMTNLVAGLTSAKVDGITTSFTPTFSGLPNTAGRWHVSVAVK